MDIDVSMEDVGSSSSLPVVVVSSSSLRTTASLHNDTNPSHVNNDQMPDSDAKQPDKKKRRGISQKILNAVVGNTNSVGIKQIMQNGLVSRSNAFSILKKSKDYPTTGNAVNKMPKVRNPEVAIQMVASLAYHLIDFPYADMVSRFGDNARCDIMESSHTDRVEAATLRTKRAQRVWKKSMDRFEGRGAMNTLLCILYSPMAVCSLVTSCHTEQTERPGHIMVLRLGGVFIVLMMDSSPSSRFSLQWFMHRGNHTSAFMWFNLKESCWLRHRGVTSSMLSTPNTKADLQPPGKMPKHIQEVDTIDSWAKVSECTMVGIHFLKYMRTKAEELAQEGAIAGTGRCHIYLRPFPVNLKMAKSTESVSDEWCKHIDEFVHSFDKSRQSMIKPVQVIAIEQIRVVAVEEVRVVETEQVVVQAVSLPIADTAIEDVKRTSDASMHNNEHSSDAHTNDVFFSGIYEEPVCSPTFGLETGEGLCGNGENREYIDFGNGGYFEKDVREGVLGTLEEGNTYGIDQLCSQSDPPGSTLPMGLGGADTSWLSDHGETGVEHLISCINPVV